MRVPKIAESAANSTSLAVPASIVVLVLVLGATIYLWRARYIRRATAYILMLVLIITLALLGLWMYSHPTQNIGP